MKILDVRKTMKINKLTDQIFNIFNNSKMYVIVAAISTILLFDSILKIQYVMVGIEDFLGLTYHLTFSYWLGLSLITCFSIKIYLDTEMKNGFVHILYLTIIGLFLFSVPIFAEENARFPWSYYPAGEVKNVIETGYIDTTADYPLMSYHSWTATHFISASILFVSNVKIENLLKYMPIFWIICIVFTVYSIGNRFKLPNNKSFLAVIILISSFWSFHYYYGPQSLAYLMYFFIFLIMISFGGRFEGIFISLLTISALIQTHLLTSIALLYSLIFSSKSLLEKNRFRFLVLVLFIFMIWYVYVSPLMFKVGVEEVENQISNIKLFSFFDSGKYEEGTLLTRQITHYTRLSYLIIYATLMSIFASLYLSGKIENKNSRVIKICSAWMIGTLGLFMFRYGPEIDDRVYILALLPMSMMVISSFSNNILIVTMILFISLHIPAHYGAESIDMVSTEELSGASFLALRINDIKEPYFYYYSLYLDYFSPNTTYWKQNRFLPGNKPNITLLDESTYIVDSNQVYNQHVYDYGYSPIKEWLLYNKYEIDYLYDNGGFKILKSRDMFVKGV